MPLTSRIRWWPSAYLILVFGSVVTAQEGSADLGADSARAGSRPGELFRAPFSTRADPDGPISTDRPTFTPANTVVPRGRFQVESGYSYSHDLTRSSRVDAHDFPELAVRVGVNDWLEFRTLWLGQIYSQEVSRMGMPSRTVSGASDLVIGFKSQLTRGDDDRPWVPTSALITSVVAPTGGSSPTSSRTVRPNIIFIYGWSLGERLSLAGSTGYLDLRAQTGDLSHRDSLGVSQSLVASFSATERTTLFHEWYTYAFTNSGDNRPLHNMDTGLLHRPTPNTQLDIRAGLGLGDRPSDFTAGAGFSIRF